MRRRRATPLLILLLLAVPAAVPAQESAFLFTVNTLPVRSARAIAVHADVGYGGSAIEPVGGNGFDQQVGFQARLRRWTALGRVGSDVTGPDHTFGRAEVLLDVFGGGGGPVLALGGGVLHEAGGTNVILARIVASQRARSWRADANLAFERPLAAGRDGLYGHTNERSSDADRLLGSGGARTRYVVRSSLSYSC